MLYVSWVNNQNFNYFSLVHIKVSKKRNISQLCYARSAQLIHIIVIIYILFRYYITNDIRSSLYAEQPSQTQS